MAHTSLTLSTRTNGAYTPRMVLTTEGKVQFVGPPLDLPPAQLQAVIEHLATMAELMEAVGFTGMRVEE